MSKYYDVDRDILEQCQEFIIEERGKRMKHNINVYDYCETFLAGRSLISIEWTDDNDPIFEGTVKELNDTLDADLRAICSVAKVRAAIPQLCLRTGTPLSTCILI